MISCDEHDCSDVHNADMLVHVRITFNAGNITHVDAIQSSRYGINIEAPLCVILYELLSYLCKIYSYLTTRCAMIVVSLKYWKWSLYILGILFANIVRKCIYIYIISSINDRRIKLILYMSSNTS